MIRLFLDLVNRANRDFREHLVKSGLAISALAVSYLLSGNIFLSFIIGSALAVLLLNWDSRVFIGVGLIFLISCPVWLALEREEMAEKMAVYAYYMLALGLILQLIRYFKESFVSPGSTKGSKSKTTKPVEFWGQKKVIAFVLITALMVVVVFAGSFSLLYLKVSAQFNENRRLISTFLDGHLNVDNKTKENLTENQQKLVEEILTTEQITWQIAWESVKVLVQDTTGEEDLAKEIVEQFRELGCTNVYLSESSETPSQNTLVEYCSGCFDITQELLTALKNTEAVATKEEPGLPDEIRIVLGKDQIIVE